MTSPGVTTTGPTTSRRSALVALAAACVVLFVGLYLVAVRTEVGQRVDEAAIEGRARDSGLQHAVFRTLDTVSVTSIFLATVALIAIALLPEVPLGTRSGTERLAEERAGAEAPAPPAPVPA